MHEYVAELLRKIAGEEICIAGAHVRKTDAGDILDIDVEAMKDDRVLCMTISLAADAVPVSIIQQGE